jgi:hypothetical protein
MAHLVRDEREHAIKLLDELNPPRTLVDAKQINGVA